MAFSRARLKPNKSDVTALYLHIPFCRQKCPYCDFYSIDTANEQLMKRYTDALITHMDDYSSQLEGTFIDTVYVGGGTPTWLGTKQLKRLFKHMIKCFDIDEDAEWTVEANPGTVDKTMLKKLYNLGVNRLSIGAQSAVNRELSSLGRIHTFEDTQIAVNEARKVGFENISVDLMYGIPGQTLETLEMSIKRLLRLNPQHISCYGLSIEKGTPFYVQRNSLDIADDDMQREMYGMICEYLKMAGYNRYEISNFSLAGYESRHNMKYWMGKEYLGLGPGAHSFINNQRFAFKRDINEYIQAVEENTSAVREMAEITNAELKCEYIMLRLRLAEGIAADDFYKQFGRDFYQVYKNKIDRYIKSGHMEYKDGHYRLTTDGLYVSNYILSDILTFEQQ